MRLGIQSDPVGMFLARVSLDAQSDENVGACRRSYQRYMHRSADASRAYGEALGFMHNWCEQPSCMGLLSPQPCGNVADPVGAFLAMLPLAAQEDEQVGACRRAYQRYQVRVSEADTAYAEAIGFMHLWCEQPSILAAAVREVAV